MFGSPSPNFGSGFNSSSSEDEDEDMFGVLSSKPRRAQPKSIKGTKTSFILGDKLGEGAYAVVKEGIDEKTLRIVAVKILDLRRLRRVRGVMSALDREVAVQKRLKKHNNLIELIDVIKLNPPKSKMYIVLEMATGCTVHELLESSPNRKLCESQVANFAYQTLWGLNYMHGRGVVHRDIKPANLMLAVDGTLKISDFGVAEFLETYEASDNVTRTSGSPAFQAPEIARGDLGYSGTKVDVWALGVTIYMLLSGDVPFKGETLMALFDNIKNGQYKMLDDVSPQCQQVITLMLTMNWEDRPSVDCLLKHPWIENGAAELSKERKNELGWIQIPKKEFGILNVVKRMFMSEDDQVPNMDMMTTSPTTPTFGPSSDRNLLSSSTLPNNLKDTGKVSESKIVHPPPEQQSAITAAAMNNTTEDNSNRSTENTNDGKLCNLM